MSRVDLPSGGWVELTDPANVPEKYIRRIRNATFGLSEGAKALITGAQDREVEPSEFMTVLTSDDVDLLDTTNDLGASALVVAWSFDENGKHPTPDQISELGSADYRKLQEIVAPQVAELMGPDFSRSSETDSPT